MVLPQGLSTVRTDTCTDTCTEELTLALTLARSKVQKRSAKVSHVVAPPKDIVVWPRRAQLRTLIRQITELSGKTSEGWK